MMGTVWGLQIAKERDDKIRSHIDGADNAEVALNVLGR